jgi:hypothetical protein
MAKRDEADGEWHTVQACQLGNRDDCAVMGYMHAVSVGVMSGVVWCSEMAALQLAYQLQSKEAIVPFSLTHAMAHRMTMAISTPSWCWVRTKLKALPS